MDDIRIGNDIKLTVRLKTDKYNKDFDQASTKRLIPYLINVTANEFVEPIDMHCFGGCHGRHGFGCCGRSHTCGHCGYHHPAHNLYFDHPCFGAGIYTWHNCWRGLHRYGTGPLPPNYGYYPWCYGQHPHPHMHHHCHPRYVPFDKLNRFEFVAPYKLLNEKNMIEVYFPAKAQFAQGEYKLLVVVQDLESGWGKHNIHTYTIDYGVVFRLTEDINSINGAVQINLETGQMDHITRDEPMKGWMGVLNVSPDFPEYNNQDQSFEETTPTPTISGKTVDPDGLKYYKNIIGSHIVESSSEGGHLWIITEEPITSVQIGAFDVPLTNEYKADGKYYYASLNSVIPNMSLKVIINA